MGTDKNKFRRVDWDGDGPLPSDDDDEHGMPVQPGGSGLSADDLELLTLAARAIGAAQVEPVEGEPWLNLHFADGQIIYGWNPLLHSDDMLALSVNQGIVIRPFPNHHQGSQVVASVLPYVEVREHAAHSGHDLVAATRRAVTRAAAEIGKQRS